MKRAMKVAGWLALGVAIAIQAIPVGRSNPPVEADLAAPPEVASILRRSCYDCHSHETRWPWYAYVAPVSWLVAGDVSEGREELNFSEWGRLDPRERGHLRREIAKQVERRAMPLAVYLAMHPGARLDDRERRLLVTWTGTPEP